LNFEWHAAKADRNVAKHGVDFPIATRIFNDPELLIRPDPRDYGEPRWQAIGLAGDRLLLVVFTMRSDDVCRIISARRA